MSKNIDNRRIGVKYGFLVPLIIAAIVFLASKIPPVATAESRFADILLTQYHSGLKASEDIVVVKITEDTLAQFPYRSPLNRSFLAEIVEKILDANAKAVGIDILIDQPSEVSKDQQLLKVLRAGKGRAFIATAGLNDGLSEAQVGYQDEHLKGISKAIVVLARDNNDGIVRHYLDSRQGENGLVKSLSNAMLGQSDAELVGGYVRIAYNGNDEGMPHQFSEYPAHTVKVLPPAWFEGKYVLIGVDLPLIDQYRTPFASVQGEAGGVLAGVKIHAHILNQLISGEKLSEISAGVSFILAAFAALSGVFLAAIRRSIWLRVGIFAGALIAVFVTSILMFKSLFLLLPAVMIASAMVLGALATSALLWQRDRIEKRFVRDAWTHYVSPVVVDDLISNPDKLETGGEKLDVTFIFTDIAGFTTLAEGMPAEELSPILNQYLDIVSGEFLKAGATIDKFVGDAVIGFIGAPIPDENHPNKGVDLAIAIDEACQKFKNGCIAKGIKFGDTRIGVHSGPAVIGNFGGSGFFDYTALGDTVNTAARLEGANKIFGSHVCISGATAGRATDHEFRPMAKLILAGKSKPVEAWEPLAVVPTDCSKIADYLDAYHSLDDKGSDSGVLFKKLAETHPNDYLVVNHLARFESGGRGTMIDLTKGPKL